MKRAILAGVFAFATAILTIPAQAAPPLETYGRLPSVEMIELSPDGKRLAFVGAIKGVRTMTVLEIGGAILAATPVESTKIRDLTWVGNDVVLIESTATSNWGEITLGENVEVLSVVSVNLKDKTSFPVLSKAKAFGAVFGMFGTRQIDGRWYGYFGGWATERTSGGNDTVLKDGMRNLYRVDLMTGDATLVANGHPNDDQWQVGLDGKVAAYSEYTSGRAEWRMYVAGRPQSPVLTRQDRFNGSSLIGLGRTPNTVLVGPPEGEDGEIVEVSLDPGVAAQTLPAPPHLRHLIFDRNTHLLIGWSSGIGSSTVTMFEAKAQGRVSGALKAFSAYSVTVNSWSDDFGRMIMLTEGGDDPGTFWLVDIATGKASVLGVRYPIEVQDVGKVRMIDYIAADGTQLQGVLTLPPGKADAKNLPVVALPHGGPASHDEAVFDFWAQAFASRGYAVFQPNFRGSTGYGDDLRNAGFGEWGRKMQTDISDGLAQLAKDGIIDPKRACIVGGSYGGYAALAGVTVQQGVYRCAVSYAGISDLSKMLEDEGSIYSPSNRYLKSFLGVKSPKDLALKEISPVELVQKVSVPVLLIHGTDDTVVSPKQSDIFEREMKKAGKPIERITLPKEDHWLSREESRTAMLKASVAFVEKHNPPN